jgi:hypothetical protein
MLDCCLEDPVANSVDFESFPERAACSANSQVRNIRVGYCCMLLGRAGTGRRRLERNLSLYYFVAPSTLHSVPTWRVLVARPYVSTNGYQKVGCLAGNSFFSHFASTGRRSLFVLLREHKLPMRRSPSLRRPCGCLLPYGTDRQSTLIESLIDVPRSHSPFPPTQADGIYLDCCERNFADAGTK